MKESVLNDSFRSINVVSQISSKMYQTEGFKESITPMENNFSSKLYSKSGIHRKLNSNQKVLISKEATPALRLNSLISQRSIDESKMVHIQNMTPKYNHTNKDLNRVDSEKEAPTSSFQVRVDVYLN